MTLTATWAVVTEKGKGREFGADQRLPEIDLTDLAPELHQMAHEVNALRDRLDGLLFGFQDYGLVGFKG